MRVIASQLLGLVFEIRKKLFLQNFGNSAEFLASFSDLSFTLNSSSTLLSIDADQTVCFGVKFLFERNYDALNSD